MNADNERRIVNEPASPIIKKLTEHFLRSRPDTAISLRDIKEYVYEKTGETFTPGSFSGAMRDLVEESNGRIANIDRGYYAYLGNVKVHEINTAIDNLIEELDQIAVVNFLKTSDQDLDTIRKIPDIQRHLHSLKIKRK